MPPIGKIQARCQVQCHGSVSAWSGNGALEKWVFVLQHRQKNLIIFNRFVEGRRKHWVVEGNPLQSMNEVSTCGKLDRSTSDFVCSKPPLFVSCAVSPGLQSFFFSLRSFPKPSTVNFGPMGVQSKNSQRRLYGRSLMRLVSVFLASRLDKGCLTCFSWGCEKRGFAPSKRDGPGGGFEIEKWRLLNYCSSYWSFGIYYFQS